MSGIGLVSALVSVSVYRNGIHTLSICIDIAALHDKLSEEHREFLSAVSRLDKCEELVDLIEVIIALAAQHGCDKAALREIVACKRSERGSFAMGFFYEGDL